MKTLRRALELVLFFSVLGALFAGANALMPFARVRWGKGERVDVLDPGSESRATLRYRWRSPPRPFTLSMQQQEGRLKGAMQLDDGIVPSVVLHFAPEESAVHFGVARVAWRIIDASIKPDGHGKQETERATAEALHHLTGHYVVTFVGPDGSTVVDVGSSPDPLEQRILDNLDRVLELELSPPLPDSAVGPGARWQAVRRQKLASFDRVVCTEHFTLTARISERFDLQTEFDFSAVPQHVVQRPQLDAPRLSSPETSAVMDRLEGGERGRMVRSFEESTPIFSLLTLQASLSVTQVETGQREPTEAQRGNGERLSIWGRESMQAEGEASSERDAGWWQ